jgi:hypothetical protein
VHYGRQLTNLDRFFAPGDLGLGNLLEVDLVVELYRHFGVFDYIVG